MPTCDWSLVFEGKYQDVVNRIQAGEMDSLSFSEFRKVGIGDDWARRIRDRLEGDGLAYRSGRTFKLASVPRAA